MTPPSHKHSNLAGQVIVRGSDSDILLPKSSHFTLQNYKLSGKLSQLVGNVGRILSHGVRLKMILKSSSLCAANGLGSPEMTNLLVDTSENHAEYVNSWKL